MPDRPTKAKKAPPRQPRQPAVISTPSGQKAIDYPVIAIGVSAGGVAGLITLLDAWSDTSGMAFIVVEHQDATHEGLLPGSLAEHTSLTVMQATDGMQVGQDHLYIIPAERFFAIHQGVLRLAPMPTGRGAHPPFDVLLQSMALECGAQTIGVVLSGTGTDGSVGVMAIKQNGGFVVAQEPGEAGDDEMPLSAIATGAVDAVLCLTDIPAAITCRRAQTEQSGKKKADPADRLGEIIDILRTETVHDFTLYKRGTLKRRVERRMAMAAIRPTEMERYVTALKRDGGEVEQLAKDLLIHVTGFFRNPDVFDILAKTVVPELIAGQQAGRTLRVWVAGCSTGEEAYSLAMVFQEQIVAAGSFTKLQIFASDADAEAVAFARFGLYSATIATEVSPARLRAFFSKDDQGYRVLPELRASVVFAVQDVLVDPPFSRIDLVSCRNVMIYLGPDAQKRVLSLFHFALRRGGILLLGNAEGISDAADRFTVISKPARMYRHIGRSRPGAVDFSRSASLSVRMPANVIDVAPLSRQSALAEFCQRHVFATQAPAVVLSNRKHECLYCLGSTDRYLRVAPGHATLSVLAMARDDLRNRLHLAILRAIKDDAPVIVSGGRTDHAGKSLAFNIEVHPVEHDGEELLLIYFVDQPELTLAHNMSQANHPTLAVQVAELERELRTTQDELQGAIRSLEISGDEQKTINENALSANEEFQSTNEELLTSKEELQSLNEELTALNSQLHETLEQQRTTSNDLRNVLYSTDVATLFLDSDLNIRFFTPATRALFNVIKTDIGRPLEDLHSLSADGALSADARTVLATLMPAEREIETLSGVWCRRILPYRGHDNAVEGVVITFTNITQRRETGKSLEVARRDAELANAAKSRFLAAASHDLRQPLQTLALLQGLLATRVAGTTSERLVARLDDTVGAMSGMLNTLLDINQIEAGIVRAEIVTFGIGDLLVRLKDAFAYQAEAQAIGFRVMPCALAVISDPRLLEQILRNLVANALKYTSSGKVLLGCRRSNGMLRIEVWDTGIGIPEGEWSSIFEEYYQLGNAARERSRGLGLGLSIVQRLASLLSHRLRVRSRPGKGSVFGIEVPMATAITEVAPLNAETSTPEREAARIIAGAPGCAGRVLIVEDDPEVRELLTLSLSDNGFSADAAADGFAALGLAAVVRPDLVLTDYNLPGGMDGLAVTAKIRAALGADLPVIVLTGDISTGVLSAITAQNCLHLNKPVTPAELDRAVREALSPRIQSEDPRPEEEATRSSDSGEQAIFVVDDDPTIRDAVRAVLEDDGRNVRDFASGEAFLEAYQPGSDGCLLIDGYLPGIGGLELLHRLRAAGDLLPAIMITGSSDVPMAVEAMKAGAADFIEKPIAAVDLLTAIGRALERSRDSSKLNAWQDKAARLISDLTPRQHQIMDLVLSGHPNKNIAADLGISQRTVENHRASIMRTTKTKSLPALARLALAANVSLESRARHTATSRQVRATSLQA